MSLEIKVSHVLPTDSGNLLHIHCSLVKKRDCTTLSINQWVRSLKPPSILLLYRLLLWGFIGSGNLSKSMNCKNIFQQEFNFYVTYHLKYIGVCYFKHK
jgi:hypothetical protein